MRWVAAPSENVTLSRMSSIAPFVAFRTLHLRNDFTGYFADTQRGGTSRLDSDNTQQINESITINTTASYHKVIKLLSPSPQGHI